MTEQQDYSLLSQDVRRVQVMIRTVTTTPDQPDFVFYEQISATREAFLDWDTGKHGDDACWVLSGDNTGSDRLVVHDYMIEPLIALLQQMKEQP